MNVTIKIQNFFDSIDEKIQAYKVIRTEEKAKIKLRELERIEKEKLARIELTNQANELNLQITEELTNKEIDLLIKAEQKKLEIEKKTADAKETARKKELAEEKKAADEKLKIAKAKAIADAKIEKDLAQQK